MIIHKNGGLIVRLLICAGGTGGGVYPALAVYQTLADNTEVLWVGSEGGMESTLVQRASIPFKSIPAAGLHGVGIRKIPRNLILLIQGIFAAKRILDRYKPDVIFFTGGFLAVPMAIAAGKTQMMLYVPDIEPGLAIKTIAKFADRIAVTSIETKEFFNPNINIIETGYPTRSSMKEWTKVSAYKHFKLRANKPVLLIFGGSKGARSINYAALKHLNNLLELAQVIHISGELDWEDVERRSKILSPEISSNYHCFPYLHEDMGAAMAAADLVISRAGASILGEYPMFSLPAILVPYPHAWRYQNINAQYLVKNGAAEILEDSRLDTELLPTAKHILGDRKKVDAMRNSMHTLYRPNAARLISEQLTALVGKRS